MTALSSSLTGDTIEFVDGNVLKSGPHGYLIDQAKLMRTIGGEHVPKIHNVCSVIKMSGPSQHSYLMEELAPITPTSLAWWPILEVLQQIAWCKKESDFVKWPAFSGGALVKFLIETNSALALHADDLSMELSRYILDDELTHGDCTFENAMRRPSDGKLVLIDWQPYRRPFVPAHRVVDYAKVFQSLIGTRQCTMELNEAHLAAVARLHPHVWFWAGVHFERIWKRAIAADDSQLAWHCKQQVRRCIQWKG